MKGGGKDAGGVMFNIWHEGQELECCLRGAFAQRLVGSFNDDEVNVFCVFLTRVRTATRNFVSLNYFGKNS